MGRRRGTSKDAALLFMVIAIVVAIVGALFKLIAAIAHGFSAGATDKQRQNAKALLGVTVAAAVVLAIVGISASHESGTSTASASPSYSPPSPSPPSTAELGSRALAEATSCIESANWSCARASLDEADRYQASTSDLREKASAAILHESQSLYDSAKTAPKTERSALLQQAASSIAFVRQIAPSGDAAAPATKLEKSIQSKLPRAPSKTVSRRVSRPTSPPPPPVEESEIEAPTLELAPSEPEGQACCKVCSTGYACGNSCISRSKSCHKGRGCACDG